MNRSKLFLGIVVVFSSPVLAVAAPPPADASRAFDQEPVSASILAGYHGGSSDAVGRLRRLADPDAVGFMQQVSRISTVAMDNWWGQAGAALIDNNLLAK